MFDSEEEKTPEPSKKKENASTAIVTALITLGSSTGLLGLFGVFSDEHSDRRGSGLQVPAIQQFITKDTRERIVSLEGDWLFRTGDDPIWARLEADDSGWETIPVPSNWDHHGYKEYDGYAWFRRSFRIGFEDTEEPLFLYLGRVDDVDEVFVNGQRIDGLGRVEPDYLTAWNLNRIYRLPSEVLNPDSENVIAVRVYDHELGGGIVSGPIGVYASTLPQPIVDLAGEWRFQKGDDASWANSSPDGFEPIRVPLIWEAGGFPEYDGFAWYQKRFAVPAGVADDTLALVLGKIDDTDEVFLNGKRIGGTGKLDGNDGTRNADFWRMNRVYEFPASLLKNENLLSVRVHDSGGRGGIYSGPVGIMRLDDVRNGEAIVENARGMTWEEVWDWMLGRD